jgi:hypothetical protein
MKHICDTIKDYEDAMQTSMQGDTIYCSNALWNHIMNEYQPERLNPKETNNSFVLDKEKQKICIDAALSCYGNCLEKEIFPQLQEIFSLCDSPTSENK